MKQKKYINGQWVTIGTTESSDIEVTSPSYPGASLTEALDKISNRLTTAEQNIVWLYNNKGTGSGSGGGTGSGSSSSNYTITVVDGDTVYTSSSSITINLIINSGGSKKAFTVTARNVSTNKVITTTKLYSMTQTALTLTGLDGTANIEISAYDSDNVYATPTYIKVVAGAIKLTLDKTPNKTIYMDGKTEVPLNFTVTNSITGSPASFELSINNNVVETVDSISTSIRTIYYDARSLLFDGEFNPKSGQKFKFSAQAATSLNGEPLTSNVISFDITVADGNNLVIVVDGIGEDEDDVTSFDHGSQIAFDYYLSCGLTKYSTFNIDYKLELYDSTGVIDTLGSGTISNVAKGSTERFNYSTVNLEPTSEGQYIAVTLFGSAVNDPGDTAGQYTKVVYCSIKEVESVDIYANNDIHTLLAYFSRVTGFPNNTTGTWSYPLKTSGQFVYEGSFAKTFKNSGVNLELFKVNGKTSGFITEGAGSYITPAIVFRGESYGRIDAGSKLFPDMDISIGASVFTSSGFNISTTFKTTDSSGDDDVILSLAKYENGEIKTGYEITTTKAVCRIGSASTINVKLPIAELVTVSLDVSLQSGTGWYFKLYLNGVLSAVTRVDESSIDWTFGDDIYLACRNDAGTLSRYSNVSIYDLKLYTSSQSDYAEVQNYISATCQAQLYNDAVNPTIDSELRIKNLFDSAGNCIIWDKDANNGKGEFLSGNMLYNKLIDQMDINTPYPLVLIEETASSFTFFQPYSTAVFSAADKGDIMDQTFACKITYQDSKGKAVISTPSGVSSDNGVRVGLQGTSSLSYNSKNYEIYMGNKDEAGNPLLFTPDDDWLPENEFTLKADVMDSAHVNNVVIGRIVNGWAKTSSGESITPFRNTPPMDLPNSDWDSSTEANNIRSKFKHTSEGFPVLLFIKYAPDRDGNEQQAQFMGIYNFNLGRKAYNNLGLKLLKSYEKENQDGPSIVTDYELDESYWNKASTSSGVYSMEINQNSSAQGAFQQDDDSIIRFMADVAYTSRDDAAAYNNVKGFYTQMANMVMDDVQKYKMDASGQTFVAIPNEFYKKDLNAYYNFAACEAKMNWNNAIGYYVLALVFGMVDSMCKNLTIRSWGGSTWYTCFYDMDTAFGLNNSGQDIVEYYAHLHRWYNTLSDANVTSYNIEKNYTSNDEVKQYYASWWNRIWEVLENLAGLDVSGSEDKVSVQSVYCNLRQNLFPDPEAFINEYYKSYTESTGSIIFNYDYSIKYLKVSQSYDANTGEYTDLTDFSQLGFLHGNRVIHVKDWFKKRIMFLDSVYGVMSGASIPSTITSPINTLWIENKATGSKDYDKIDVTMAASSKMLYQYKFDQVNGSYWLSEDDQDAMMLVPAGETIVSIYANKYIKTFKNLKKINWTNLRIVDFPLLEELDLSGLANMDSDYLFSGGVYNPTEGKGLKSIKKLNLSGVKLIGSNSATYQLDVSNCDKLQELDISNSSITNVLLSDEAVLKTLNMQGINITNLKMENQSFLETLNIEGCEKLETIEVTNCNSLKTISVPSSVKTVTIKSCEMLESLEIPYNGSSNNVSSLTSILVDNCPGLKKFNIYRQNNPNLVVDLVGAWNLEDIDIQSTQYKQLTLPPLMVNGEPYFTSLKSINISNTSIDHLEYNDSVSDYLDLSNFPDLSSLSAYGCENLKIVKLTNNPDNPIELSSNAFTNCKSLNRIYGYVDVQASNVFSKCSSLKLNDDNTYNDQYENDFLIGDDVFNIKFSTNIIDSMFDSCSSLSYEDFRFLMRRMNEGITSANKTFNGCSSISGDLWKDMFRLLPNLVSANNMLDGTNLTGLVTSRSENYKDDDKSTWGILDYLPNCKEYENFLANTGVNAIDNNLYQPKPDGTPFPASNITGMFSGCSNLKAVVSTRGDSETEQPLDSETFFLHLDNLTDTYPKNVFQGTKVKMKIAEDASGNTLLFHKKNKVTGYATITNALYNGVELIGEIKENVFGGVSQTTDNYYIPKFQAITTPFGAVTDNISVNMDNMSRIFSGFSDSLKTAVGVFNGLKITGDIPADIFKGCSVLTNISSIFANIDFGKTIEFPMDGLFDDCVELQNISSILSGCHHNKIKLKGEGFKNCKLKDVSNAFNSSGIYGFIPYRLFYMEDAYGNIRRTIETMSGVFTGCYYLGYDETRVLDTVSVLNGKTDVTYGSHVVVNEGNPMNFKLDMSKAVDDTWYLDGYGAEDANDYFQGLVADYIQYDLKQKECIEAQSEYAQYKDTYQNYIVPTDLFRYCSKDCNLKGILSSLSWYKNIISTDDEGLEYIEATTVREGLKGRLPMRLLESLTDLESASELLNGANIEPFVGLISAGSVYERGIMYPPDLFTHNTSLTDVSKAFAFLDIPLGVDVNADIFDTNVNLRNASSLWEGCNWNGKQYDTDTDYYAYSQITYSMFNNCSKLSDVSSMFAVYDTNSTGLRKMSSTFLNQNMQISNISSMFINNSYMKGSVPTFKTASYAYLKQYDNYIKGVAKSNIDNASELEDRLIPDEWNN